MAAHPALAFSSWRSRGPVFCLASSSSTVLVSVAVVVCGRDCAHERRCPIAGHTQLSPGCLHTDLQLGWPSPAREVLPFDLIPSKPSRNARHRHITQVPPMRERQLHHNPTPLRYRIQVPSTRERPMRRFSSAPKSSPSVPRVRKHLMLLCLPFTSGKLVPSCGKADSCTQ